MGGDDVSGTGEPTGSGGRTVGGRDVRLPGAAAAATAVVLAVAHLAVAGSAAAGTAPGLGTFAWILLPPVLVAGFALATLAFAFGRTPLPRGLLLGAVWTHTVLVAALVALSLAGFATGVPVTLSTVFGAPFAYALVSLIAYTVLLVRLRAGHR
ncbi:hypothetical protein [Streptomonospora salina]|uniref:Uncharacterized protein n=1 Tax=Streptomonospora salina TaxID=104205 RepID=A0A841EC81_9ACTN|nr:hypothetical protein [Streptomonospora salina]MBB6000692.1 hypothetical protein [Streptomonospora salina]